jgi:hypothetical protein
MRPPGAPPADAVARWHDKGQMANDRLGISQEVTEETEVRLVSAEPVSVPEGLNESSPAL